MKKLLAFILILVCVSATALADNYSTMSYNVLINIQRQIVIEIMSRPEWKEVEVPAGQWRVGEDIPEGTYSIKPSGRSVLVQIWGKTPGDYKTNGGMILNEIIDKGEVYGKIELKKGWILELTDPVIIAPPAFLGF